MDHQPPYDIDWALVYAALRHSSSALAEQSKGFLPDLICDRLEELAARIKEQNFFQSD